MPCTGGGGKIAMNASGIAAYFWLSCIAMAPPERSFERRSSNGFSVAKTIPAFELLVKPLIESPGKATACSTPGCFSVISPMRRITSSVRSSVAPSGSCAKPIRYCLSCVGTKPCGIARSSPKVTAAQYRVDADRDRLAREHAAEPSGVGVRRRA